MNAHYLMLLLTYWYQRAGPGRELYIVSSPLFLLSIKYVKQAHFPRKYTQTGVPNKQHFRPPWQIRGEREVSHNRRGAHETSRASGQCLWKPRLGSEPGSAASWVGERLG